MTINIPHLISLSFFGSQPRASPRSALPSHKRRRDMFPTACSPRARGPHPTWMDARGTSTQQVQAPRYLSIIIVADNGALDASNYRENETGIARRGCESHGGRILMRSRVLQAAARRPLCAAGETTRPDLGSRLIADVGISSGDVGTAAW